MCPCGTASPAKPGALGCTKAEVNVESGQRFEVTRVLQAAGINRAQADAFDQHAGGLLGALAVAGVKRGGDLAVIKLRTLRQHLRKQRVERLHDFSFRKSLGDFFGGGGVVADRQAHEVGGERIGGSDALETYLEQQG